jgi:hypothetical protein
LTMDEAAASVPGWRAGLEPRMLRTAGILVGVMFLVCCPAWAFRRCPRRAWCPC